ncbi:MAG: hypothetical protein GTO63_30160 [Anaerolineae bacterium]|nr:hypothetical protein [Anaerolineae bacterium]
MIWLKITATLWILAWFLYRLSLAKPRGGIDPLLQAVASLFAVAGVFTAILSIWRYIP